LKLAQAEKNFHKKKNFLEFLEEKNRPFFILVKLILILRFFFQIQFFQWKVKPNLSNNNFEKLGVEKYQELIFF